MTNSPLLYRQPFESVLFTTTVFVEDRKKDSIRIRSRNYRGELLLLLRVAHAEFVRKRTNRHSPRIVCTRLLQSLASRFRSSFKLLILCDFPSFDFTPTHARKDDWRALTRTKDSSSHPCSIRSLGAVCPTLDRVYRNVDPLYHEPGSTFRQGPELSARKHSRIDLLDHVANDRVCCDGMVRPGNVCFHSPARPLADQLRRS